MKEACKVVKQTTGIEVDLDTIPIDDELTYKLYQEGRTIGTFQFESPGMQKYLRELHPTVFEDLIAMNALYRPGPMDYIPNSSPTIFPAWRNILKTPMELQSIRSR